MKKKIVNVLKKSSTLPFIFVGSGLSRRYLETDDWSGLLRNYAEQINGHEFAYEIYLQKVKSLGHKEGELPKLAELIENDFNEMWFTNPQFAESRKENGKLISENVSPFKIEIAKDMLIKSEYVVESLKDEYKAFERIGNKGVAGFITTNYDVLLEKTFSKFTTYIGQEELIFSQIQGVSEIYKIHGCATKPGSIVINEKDYLDFSEKNAYLASKLLTIFLEHPIIFIGYSISDKNIENILKSIVQCLSQEHLVQLKERLIFVEWIREGEEEISTYSKSFEGDKSIDMTRIRLKEFGVLYEALFENNAKYNVSMLRKLKEDIYELVLTNKPTSRIRTIGLEDDDKLDEVEVVVGVGVLSEFGHRGYLGVSANEIYQDILLDDGDFEQDRIVCDTLPILLPRNSSLLPMYKYLNGFKGEIPEKVDQCRRTSLDEFLSNTVKKSRDRSIDREKTIKEIREDYSSKKCLLQLQYLKQENIVVEDLRDLLTDFFKDNPSIFENEDLSSIKSDFKRAIRIYDWLKFGQ